MIEQYLKLKEQYHDCTLLFRLGDFYEMFFQDAIQCSEILKLTLTARYKNTDHEVPMCGMPYHAAASYIKKLSDLGHKIAICEQMEEPKPGKLLVERAVVQIVTPALPYQEEDAVEDNHYLLAVCEGDEPKTFSIAYTDVVTGEFYEQSISDEGELRQEISRIKPKEILVTSPSYEMIYKILSQTGQSFCIRIIENSEILRTDLLKPSDLIQHYLSYAKNSSSLFQKKLFSTENYMQLDSQTLEKLDVLHDEPGKKSLFKVLNFTKTAMGTRLLKRWLKYPLLDSSLIEARLDSVSEFVAKPSVRSDLQKKLRFIYDLDRINAKIQRERATPRDLSQLLSSLVQLNEIQQFSVIQRETHPAQESISAIIKLLEGIFVENPPMSLKEGGIFANGFSKELDELINLSVQGASWVAQYEQQEREKTRIQNLKVKYNSIFGYFIEITKSYLDKVPQHYERKQTLTQAERFTTQELSQYESSILSAEEKRKSLEYELFVELRKKLINFSKHLQAVSDFISNLDVILSFAQAAGEYSYVRPQFSQSLLNLKNSRHPVVEREVSFIPNSIEMPQGELHLITGPNMAGKSTVMRQVALSVLMAHVGCFVPAEAAFVPLTDRIFTRIGSSDDIASGESTFMVEMKETSAILQRATQKSLIILDEIGRGTSTFDGLSLAWAIAEYINLNIQARTLFATHYHELTVLADIHDRIKNYHVDVKKEAEDIIFLRVLKPGALSSSFGIEVARLARLPDSVIERARGVLNGLKLHQNLPDGFEIKNRANFDQPPLFQN
ncbi:MAG: DNA mismatch repair protein MutS [Deltaproteobacteria bacterium]|nr:DNA mismatch repair protein MutS [Deltaproteobacteria bacterium]